MLVQCLRAPWSSMCAAVKESPEAEIPAALQIMYVFFLYCAVFRVSQNFYYKVPHWDKWLHAFSAVMAATRLHHR